MLSPADALPDTKSRDNYSSDYDYLLTWTSSPPRPAKVGQLENEAAPTAKPPPVTSTSDPPMRKPNSKKRRQEERQRRADAADMAAAYAAASKRRCVRPSEAPKFYPELLDRAGITAKLSRVPRYPAPAGPFYTASDQLVGVLRKLICTWNVDCALCSLHYKAPDATRHRLENCHCLDESSDARDWLMMFNSYHPAGKGKGARCPECRFPSTLCWRTVYREDMDEEYGNEKEALEHWDVIYTQPQCDWVKIIQRFVSGCMVVGSCLTGSSVSSLGSTVLEHMGWRDWSGLEENGPKHIQNWLQEMDEVNGLRCPRLLKLFWFLAHVTDESHTN